MTVYQLQTMEQIVEYLGKLICGHDREERRHQEIVWAGADTPYHATIARENGIVSKAYKSLIEAINQGSATIEE